MKLLLLTVLISVFTECTSLERIEMKPLRVYQPDYEVVSYRVSTEPNFWGSKSKIIVNGRIKVKEPGWKLEGYSIQFNYEKQISELSIKEKNEIISHKNKVMQIPSISDLYKWKIGRGQRKVHKESILLQFKKDHGTQNLQFHFKFNHDEPIREDNILFVLSLKNQNVFFQYNYKKWWNNNRWKDELPLSASP